MSVAIGLEHSIHDGAGQGRDLLSANSNERVVAIGSDEKLGLCDRHFLCGDDSVLLEFLELHDLIGQ